MSQSYYVSITDYRCTSRKTTTRYLLVGDYNYELLVRLVLKYIHLPMLYFNILQTFKL